jgi:hypothetical protein
MIMPNISQRQQAQFMTTGLLLVMFLGMVSAFALVFGLLYVLAQLLLLAIEAIVQTSQAIGATFQAGDSLTKFLILFIVGYILYRVGKRIFVRRGAK